ncbi:MAG: PilZ domain-containing protein [Nitrospira sp. CG24C]|nr:MAG: PilZ domain-containing protein [Nitrospira sp. CG24C]TKB53559.1 MAG: PilZ domain-containing protein [Nitrospira sp.]
MLRLVKRQSSKSVASIAVTNERRKFVRATLVGSALISPKSGAKAITAVLDNVNRVGAGLHTKEKLAMAQPVTVSLAFLDSDRVEQMEKLDGKVAWMKPWEKGFLIGVIWDELVTKEKNRWLYYYLEETVKSSI